MMQALGDEPVTDNGLAIYCLLSVNSLNCKVVNFIN